VISKSEIDTLIERAWISLDQAEKQIRDEGLMKAAA
jgi:putrescine aminotransferase